MLLSFILTTRVVGYYRVNKTKSVILYINIIDRYVKVHVTLSDHYQ